MKSRELEVEINSLSSGQKRGVVRHILGESISALVTQLFGECRVTTYAV